MKAPQSGDRDEALRLVAKDVCARLRVLPLSLSHEGSTNVLRIAMADPTDTSAILELEQLAACEIEVTALPLSTIEELVEKGYHGFSTAITKGRDRLLGAKRTTRNGVRAVEADQEVSVTMPIPVAATQPVPAPPDFEERVTALYQLLVAKGLITELEFSETLRKLRAIKGA